MVRWPVLLAAALALASTPAAADAMRSVSRADAARLGAERGPAVLEARAPLAAVAEVRDAAGLPVAYAPRVAAAGGARHGDFGLGPELAASVTQDLSLHGLGSARRDAADALDRAGRSDVERARLEGAAAAVLAWIDLVEAQELVALRARARQDADAIARIADARVLRGIAVPIEASLAASEVGAAELAERDGEGKRFEAEVGLRFAVGAPRDEAVQAVGTLDVEIPRANRAPPAEHAAVTAARARVSLAAADADLAHAQASAPFGLGAGVLREGTGQTIVTAQLTIPLPFLDPGRFDGARQQAHVLAARAHAQRIENELARDVTLAEHEVTHTREVHATLRDRVVVPLREAVRVARAAYENGTQDATALLYARQRLVSAEEQLTRATANVARADVRLAVARGSLLDEVAR